MDTLCRIYGDIDDRVRAIRNDNMDWPCREGCDDCCRQLADVPRFTAEEWSLLRKGLAALSRERLQAIGQEIAALAGQLSGPIICPLLDRSNGACLVYEYRPTVCRTCGFYVQRDRGFYCKRIESHVTEGLLDGVVWGNQEAVDQRLRGLGDTRELTHWFIHGGMP